MSASNPLGNITKSSTLQDGKSERWIRFYLQSLARELLPDERIKICLRYRRKGKETVDVMYNARKKSAHYSGLMRCASVWNCAVCAAAISEKRRLELAMALDATRKKYMRLLITYTMRHAANERLAANLKILKNAYDGMKEGENWTNLKYEFGWVGSVRATEITYGANGWHPHYHELVLIDWDAVGRDMKPRDIRNALVNQLDDRWLLKLSQAGGNGLTGIALDISAKDGKIDEYISKYGRLPVLNDKEWNESHEIAKQASKRSKASDGGLTVWELLAAYGNGDKKAGWLFQEYAQAMKGKRMMVWSRGLRELVGLVPDEPDECLADEDQNDDILLSSLSIEQWRLVLRRGKRAELLDIASTGDKDKFEAWLDSLISDTSEYVPFEILTDDTIPDD